MRLGERCGEIEYRGGSVTQRWRGSSGNVRISYLLISLLFCFWFFPYASDCTLDYTLVVYVTVHAC